MPKILTPWNASYFIPLNGFHPLYSELKVRALERAKGFRYIVPKSQISRFGLELLDSQTDVYKSEVKSLSWANGLSAEDQDRFYDFFSLNEINYIGSLPGDVEFLHTSPITSGERDFIFHCESFAPIFMPFLMEDGQLNCSNLEGVISCYRKLFKERCLAIISHNQDTIDKISQLFNDEKIDKLLVCKEISIYRGCINKSVSKDTKAETFLFVLSAHQNMNNFVYRGGVVALKLAILLFESGQEFEFIFRCQKPNDTFFVKYGIDLQLISEAESAGSIVWIEKRLSDCQMDRLIEHSDFLLLVSSHLHSVSILSALQYGVIPIVSNIDECRIYLNEQNAIFVDGIKEFFDKKVEFGNVNINLLNSEKFLSDHEIFSDLLACTIFDAVSDKERVARLRGNLKTRVNEESEIESLPDLLESIVCRANQEVDFTEDLGGKLGEVFIEDLKVSHFNHPPQPIQIANVAHGRIEKFLNRYIYLDRLIDQQRSEEGCANYSLIQRSLAEINLDRLSSRGMFTSTKKEEVIDFLIKKDGSPFRLHSLKNESYYRAYFLTYYGTLVTKISHKLRPYPAAFRMAKKAHYYICLLVRRIS